MEKFKNEKEIKKIITHEGPFHADEVFAMAILKDLFPESMELKEGGKKAFVEYLRSRNPKLLSELKQSSESMLVDVGFEYDSDSFNMDHHQEGGAGRRENGIDYASAGLIWKHFGKEWIKYIDTYHRNIKMTPEENDLIFNLIDKNYIQLIDSNDTGQMNDVTYSFSNGDEINGFQFTIPEIVRLKNVDTHDGKTQDQRFNETVELFRDLTLGMINRYMDSIEGVRKFKIEECEFSQKGKTAIITQPMPPLVRTFIIANNDAFEKVEFVAAQDIKGGYSINPVAVGENSRIYKNSDMIPEELRLGTNIKKMNEIIGVEKGIRFSHPGGFFASCNDISTARKFLEYCENKEK